MHTEAFTHRSFYTQELSRTRNLYAQKPLHRSFSTPDLLHTEAFPHPTLYTQKLLHTEAELLQTDAFTHRSMSTQKLFHTQTCHTYKLYTHDLLRTRPFTHISLDTQKLLQKPVHTNVIGTSCLAKPATPCKQPLLSPPRQPPEGPAECRRLLNISKIVSKIIRVYYLASDHRIKAVFLNNTGLCFLPRGSKKPSWSAPPPVPKRLLSWHTLPRKVPKGVCCGQTRPKARPCPCKAIEPWVQMPGHWQPIRSKIWVPMLCQDVLRARLK